MGKRGNNKVVFHTLINSSNQWHRKLADGPMRRAMVAALLAVATDRPTKQAHAEELEKVIYVACPDRASYIQTTTCKPEVLRGMISELNPALLHTLASLGGPLNGNKGSPASLENEGSLSTAGSCAPSVGRWTGETAVAAGASRLRNSGLVAALNESPSLGSSNIWHHDLTPGLLGTAFSEIQAKEDQNWFRTGMLMQQEVDTLRLSRGQKATLQVTALLGHGVAARWLCFRTLRLLPNGLALIRDMVNQIPEGKWRFQRPGSDSAWSKLQSLQLSFMWMWFDKPNFQDVKKVVNVVLQHHVLSNMAYNLLCALQTASQHEVYPVGHKESQGQADLLWAFEAYGIGAAGLLQWVLQPTNPATSHLTPSQIEQLLKWHDQLLQHVAADPVFILLNLHTVAVSMLRTKWQTGLLRCGGIIPMLPVLASEEGMVMHMEGKDEFLAMLLKVQYTRDSLVSLDFFWMMSEQGDLRQHEFDLLMLSSLAQHARHPHNTLSTARNISLARVTAWKLSLRAALLQNAQVAHSTKSTDGSLWQFPGLLGWQLHAAVTLLQVNGPYMPGSTKCNHLLFVLPAIIHLAVIQLAWVMHVLESEHLPVPKEWEVAPEVGPLCCQVLHQAFSYLDTAAVKVLGPVSLEEFPCLIAASRHTWPTGCSPTHHPTPGVAACCSGIRFFAQAASPRDGMPCCLQRQGFEALVCFRKYLDMLEQRFTEDSDLLLGSKAASLQAQQDTTALLMAGLHVVEPFESLSSTSGLQLMLCRQVCVSLLSLAEMVVGAVEQQQQRQPFGKASSLAQTSAAAERVLHTGARRTTSGSRHANMEATNSATEQDATVTKGMALECDVLRALAHGSLEHPIVGASSCAGKDGLDDGRAWSMCCNPRCTNLSTRSECELPLPVKCPRCTAAAYCSAKCYAQAHEVHAAACGV